MMQGGLAAVVLTLGSLACAYADPTDPANGWRGNGTGLWPNARPPLQWQRIPLGIVANLRARANPLVDRSMDVSAEAHGSQQHHVGMFVDGDRDLYFAPDLRVSTRWRRRLTEDNRRDCK